MAPDRRRAGGPAGCASRGRPGPATGSNFLRRDLPRVSVAQLCLRDGSTDFSTAFAKSLEQKQKWPLIHPQFTLNPQLVHEVASGLDTLPIAAFSARPPKSSGGFSCPRTPAWIQESPAAAATPTSPVPLKLAEVGGTGRDPEGAWKGLKE